MDAYCTYFDRRYVAQGLALYESLRRHARPFRLFVLCLDEACHGTLSRLALPEVVLLSMAELEAADPGLLEQKPMRTPVEYYFTSTPSLVLHLLERETALPMVTYLDADLYFFDRPDAIFAELSGHSVGIVPHRFAPHLKDREKFGIYNVGWLSFRRDPRGLECLRDWRRRCLEWCHDWPEPGRYADQKYLDEWPSRFEGVRVVEHLGANVAPWNLANHPLRLDGEKVRVGEAPLLFFHFHGLRRAGPFLYDTHLSAYGVKASAVLRRRVYGPYIQDLEAVRRRLRKTEGISQPSRVLGGEAPASPTDRPRAGVAALLSAAGRYAKAAARPDYLIVAGGHVL